jgi:hypothetical protein
MSRRFPDRLTAQERLLRHRFIDSSGCWLWTGAVNGKAGYGYLTVHRHNYTAHRLAAWGWLGWSLRSPLKVCHTCDVTVCFNPDHFFQGTQADNIHDAITKGRLDQARIPRPQARLTAENVRTIRSRCAAGEQKASLAREFGVSYGSITQVIKNQSYRWVQ